MGKAPADGAAIADLGVAYFGRGVGHDRSVRRQQIGTGQFGVGSSRPIDISLPSQEIP